MRRSSAGLFLLLVFSAVSLLFLGRQVTEPGPDLEPKRNTLPLSAAAVRGKTKTDSTESASLQPPAHAAHSEHPSVWPLPRSWDLSDANARVAIVPDPRSLARLAQPNFVHDSWSVALNTLFSSPTNAACDTQSTPGTTIRSFTAHVRARITDAVPRGFNEAYSLEISVDSIAIDADNYLGVLHALKTLAQLITWSNNETHTQDRQRQQVGSVSNRGCLFGSISVPIHIEDVPDLEYRGFLVDPPRVFFALTELRHTIDRLFLLKLNVLHLRLTDDQSFVWNSDRVPGMCTGHNVLITDRRFGQCYSTNDLRAIVEYARVRGIRVVPEIDVPGHAGGWENKRYNLTALCPSMVVKKLLNPTNPVVWSVLAELLDEVTSIFPDPVLHLGGDEPFPWNADEASSAKCCWQLDKTLQQKLTFSISHVSDAISVLFKGESVAAQRNWIPGLFDVPEKNSAQTLVQTLPDTQQTQRTDHDRLSSSVAKLIPDYTVQPRQLLRWFQMRLQKLIDANPNLRSKATVFWEDVWAHVRADLPRDILVGSANMLSALEPSFALHRSVIHVWFGREIELLLALGYGVLVSKFLYFNELQPLKLPAHAMVDNDKVVTAADIADREMYLQKEWMRMYLEDFGFKQNEARRTGQLRGVVACMWEMPFSTFHTVAWRFLTPFAEAAWTAKTIRTDHKHTVKERGANFDRFSKRL